MGSNDSPVLLPAPEAVDLSRMDQDLADLELWLLPLG